MALTDQQVIDHFNTIITQSIRGVEAVEQARRDDPMTPEDESVITSGEYIQFGLQTMMMAATFEQFMRAVHRDSAAFVKAARRIQITLRDE